MASYILFPDTVDDGTLWDDALAVVASSPRSCSKEQLCDPGATGGPLIADRPLTSSDRCPSEKQKVKPTAVHEKWVLIAVESLRAADQAMGSE